MRLGKMVAEPRKNGKRPLNVSGSSVALLVLEEYVTRSALCRPIRRLERSKLQTMPSITSTAVKTEKVQVLDVPESFKSATTVIEKKCRNLEKRKVNVKTA